MAKDSSTSFLARLERSNLLAPDVMARVRDEFADIDPPLASSEIANRLVARNLLTHWQADMLLGGRNGFFLGRYKLLDRLGTGGMGSVFKAQKGGQGRFVALKIMARALLKNPAAVARFRREIQAAAALDHPNIVAALDADCVDDTHFLVMEYVDGRDLGEIAAEHGALPLEWTCECIRQAAVGLQHAYERGMVHRDIKPSNILVLNHAPDEQIVVKILDMGLARVVSESSNEGELTQTGQVMGTPDYIAPEQARNTRSADIRSDIFSLGCTLYKLLTGSLPYDGANVMEKLMARALTDAPPLRRLRPDAPAALETVVAKMLAREPADRFQTPIEAAQALLPFCGYAELPMPVVEPAADSVDRVLLPSDPGIGDPNQSELDQLLQQLATDIQQDSRPEIPQMAAAPAKTAVVAAKKKAVRAAEQTSAGRSGSTINAPATAPTRRAWNRKQPWIFAALAAVVILPVLSYGLWSSGDVTKLTIAWDPAERKGGSLEVDGTEVPLTEEGDLIVAGPAATRSLKLKRPGYVPISETVELSRGANVTWTPEWEPTAETVRKAQFRELAMRADRLKGAADADQTGTIRDEVKAFQREHAGTREAIQAAGLLARLHWPLDELSHDRLPANVLAACATESPSTDFPELVGVLGNPELAHWRPVWGARISPDRTTIAAGGEDNLIRLWDVAGKAPVRTLRHHTKRVLDLAFHPQGKLLYSVGDEGAFVYDLASNRVVRKLSGHANGLRSVAVSPDGEWIVTGSFDRTAKLWKAADGTLARNLDGFRDLVASVDFSHDSKKVAAVSFDGSVRVWDVGKSGAPAPRLFEMTGEKVDDAKFARNDLRLAFTTQSGNAYLIDLLDDKGTPLLFQKGGAVSVAFSADGKSIVVGQSDGQLQLWDRDRLDQRSGKRIKPHMQWVNSVEFIDDRTVLSCSREGSVRVTNVFATRKNDEFTRPAGPIVSLAFHPDGRTLVSGGSDRIIREWDLVTGAEIRRFGTHNHNVMSLVYTPDGRHLFSASWEGEVFMWDVFAGKKHLDLPRHPAHPLRMALHPEGKPLAVAVYQKDDHVKLWDIESPIVPEILRTAPQAHSVAFSPDGKSIVTGSTELTLWDSATRKKQAALETVEKDAFRAVAFSPDGQLIAAGRNTKTVELYDVKTRKRKRTLIGHEHFVDMVAFSPDGKVLASCAWDGTVILWDPVEGRMTKKFELGPQDSQVQHIAFSPDGRHLATANANGTIYILRLGEREPAKTAAR